MAAKLPKNRADVSGSQDRKYVPAPAVVVELLELSEIRERWGIGVDRIYRAVDRGALRAYGRPGHQKYYSAAEVIACFNLGADGGPTGPDSGRYAEQGEFDIELVA
jgi:hypothetical protein